MSLAYLCLCKVGYREMRIRKGIWWMQKEIWGRWGHIKWWVKKWTRKENTFLINLVVKRERKIRQDAERGSVLGEVCRVVTCVCFQNKRDVSKFKQWREEARARIGWKDELWNWMSNMGKTEKVNKVKVLASFCGIRRKKRRWVWRRGWQEFDGFHFQSQWQGK